MKKLFIIGNGFDIAHCLLTSYEDFKKYLCNEYLDGRDISEGEISEAPISNIGPKGDDIYDMERLPIFSSVLYHILSQTAASYIKESFVITD